ncbi:MAG: tRNA (adenine-N1)-methyltransferase [Candidatus Saelkia tenebricola]|nr:tRNA (adenine-N1)-methyltransferase [Candidatus Saelkia tenebricola]
MCFKEGDLVIIKDKKERSFIQKLTVNGRFQTHLGLLNHSQVIGQKEGAVLLTSTEQEVCVFSPTLNEFIQKMGRKTAIIHPKDIGIIILWSDIKQGSLVVEAGTGSGALLMAISRFIGDQGHVYSYDSRPELQEIAAKNLAKFCKQMPANVTLKQKDITTGIDEKNLDAVILDFSQPWEVIPAAKEVLKSGGRLTAYIPTIIQAERLVRELDLAGCFMDTEILEVLLRPWQIKGYSVRPLHRMIGHTGFMVFTKLRK